MNKYLRFLTDPVFRFSILTDKGVYNRLSDEDFLKKRYKIVFKKDLDLENPRTFTEKLQWLKLHDRKPEYTKMVCKCEAKKHVASLIGEEYIIPTLGVWDSFDEINFDALPNQFVLKCTHDSGGLVICHDKSKLDKKYARQKIEKCLKRNYYWSGREWPYKNVKPRIIAEKLITEISNPEGLMEYKIFCFNGKPQMVLVCKGQAHGAGRTNDFCDLDLNRYPFTSLNPNSKGELKRPEELDEILRIAEVLSQGICQIRVDTYLVNGRIYFGELTFFHNSGMKRFEPAEWDEKIGSLIKLPIKED